MAQSRGELTVVHVLEALTGAGAGLWGKERVVAHLAEAQKNSGVLRPALATLSPCSLANQMRDAGFPVTVLARDHRTLPIGGAIALRRLLAGLRGPVVVHSHEYKANVVCRLLRRTPAGISRLVSTSHGWVDATRALRAYNAFDRWTAPLSDVTTVPDRKMLARFPPAGRFAYVPNAVPDATALPPEDRAVYRRRLSIPAESFAVGFLGRTSFAKGTADVIEAARRTAALPVTWVFGGAGEYDEDIRAASQPNVRHAGYIDNPAEYLNALDAFVQASHSEGLSLALLEAMRAGLPIVATDVGSTSDAVRHGVEALIVSPQIVEQLVDAVRRLSAQREFAAQLGRAARVRFERDFTIERQHRRYLALYHSL